MTTWRRSTGPRVLYKCVGNQTASELVAWVDSLEAGGGGDTCVLVGAPASDYAPCFARERVAPVSSRI